MRARECSCLLAHYTGQVHCHNCHKKQKRHIPARMLFNKDASLYPVCTMAAKFLDAMYEMPSISVSTANADLYVKSKRMRQVQLLRQQLIHMKAFVMTCSKKEQLLKRLGSRTYMLTPSLDDSNVAPDLPDIYSIRDLVDIFKNDLAGKLAQVTEALARHITSECVLCASKGFYCEICHDQRPIYAFQLLLVSQCPRCKACYHQKCLDPKLCPKCARIRRRRARAVK